MTNTYTPAYENQKHTESHALNVVSLITSIN